MKKSTFVFVLLAAFLTIISTATSPVRAQDKQTSQKPTVTRAVKFDISPPLRTMTPILTWDDREKADDDQGELGPVNNTRYDTDPVVQRVMGNGVFNSSTEIVSGVSFNGLSNPIACNGCAPPDPNGDIGPLHYVQMVNVKFQIFTRAGVSVFGPANTNTVFTGFGGPCQTENAGDPIVLYDQLADRWLLSQFTDSNAPFFNCVAISTTGDPTGSYYRYAFSAPTFPDYPKYAVWSNAYYLNTRETGGGVLGNYALDRARMLVGNPAATSIRFTTAETASGPNGLLPSDLDGNMLPPAGSPNYFVGTRDNGFGAPSDALLLYKFHADFAVPANSTFTGPTVIPTEPFDSIFPCSGGSVPSRNCIPQPGTTNRLDILSYRQRPTFRLAYRNYGTHESLVTSQSVEAAAGIAGMRWYELRSPNTTPTIFQQGTYAPADGIHRWMGSIAMDNDGNMALGYSVSSATVFPGVRYTGRLSTDPLGTMPQGEGVIVNGAGSQTAGGSRWGDYSSMSVDSLDDCTFWYTQEYYSATSASNWNTRIGSFIFPGCSTSTAAGVTVAGRVLAKRSRALVGLQRAVVSITGNGGQTRTTQTDANGNFRFEEVASGETYIFNVQAKGYQFSPQAINVTEDIEGLTFIGR